MIPQGLTGELVPGVAAVVDDAAPLPSLGQIAPKM